MREAPSGYLIEKLLKAGARVQGHDPHALNEYRRLRGYPSVTHINSVLLYLVRMSNAQHLRDTVSTMTTDRSTLRN